MITRALATVGACALLSTGCSLGQGEGEVHSDKLIARDCWDRAYDLQPDFFAAVPYRDTLQIRVQRGNDLQEVSDGLAILIDDIKEIRSKLGVLWASDFGPDSFSLFPALESFAANPSAPASKSTFRPPVRCFVPSQIFPRRRRPS